MLLEGRSSLEDRWLSVFRELGEPEALLACTFTFQADFFAALLARFANGACENSASTGRSFAHLPVDVVCDRSRYKGHRIGFNVTLWPNAARLFHSKLFIALFRDEVVWSDGSLNLTPAGWHRNREIAMLHRPKSRVLPRQLRQLLAELPRVAAACRIRERTKDQSQSDLPGTFLTSLDAPIGQQFLSASPRSAEEIHLVAPFFEKDESNDAAFDDKWLRLLAHRYPDARFHVYLPRLEAEPLRVQGRRAMFDLLERQLTYPIALHPVTLSPGPLHGKVACIVHTPQRIQRALMLVGSPNMTHAALMAPTSRGNVESAWILDERWKDAKGIFRGLDSRACSLADAEFVEPSMSRVNVWTPLRRAVFDPLEQVLHVEWKDASDVGDTAVQYAGRALAVEENECRDFALVESVSWLVTRKRSGAALDGCCPIEIPVNVLRACQHDAAVRSPEDWLRMLGAMPFVGSEIAGRTIIKRVGKQRNLKVGFEWSERVRDLSARMRYFVDALSDTRTISIEREWLHKLFHHIYDSHDPKASAETHQSIWRVWVRLEMWQAAESLAAGAATKVDRTEWRQHAVRLRRRVGLSGLSPMLRSQMRVAIKALGAPR